MVDRRTINKAFKAYIASNIKILITKRNYYTNHIEVLTHKFNIFKESLANNSREFRAVYKTPVSSINSNPHIIIYNNKVKNDTREYLDSTLAALKVINIDYNIHTITFIKSMADTYLEVKKELTSYKRELRIIEDKLAFVTKYAYLSKPVIYFIIAQINKEYCKIILDGGNLGLGRIGSVRVRPKNVSGKIDWKSSFEIKKKIEEDGKKPYNKEDALRAKAEGVKYDGVHWMVYYTNEVQHYINWYHDYAKSLPNKDFYSFIPTRYNNTRLLAADIAAKIKTVDDINAYNLGMVNKLNILLNANEMQFTKYMRDDIQFDTSGRNSVPAG